MKPDLNNPKTWPGYRPTIIAHDVARSRDRSTAVVGGVSPFNPQMIGIEEAHELPQKMLGQRRADELAAIDRKFGSRSLIVADVSTDPTYAEVLFGMFQPRFIGVHITRNGSGMEFQRWQLKNGYALVYTIGRTQLFDILHRAFLAEQMRLADGPACRQAYEQLNKLQIELRDSGRLYNCLPGEHDDLGISFAMLVFAAQHLHLQTWMRALEPRNIWKPKPSPPASGWT